MVKCAECGYLAVRNKDSYSLDEAGSDFREKGIVALGREHGRNQYPLHEPRPLCFVQQYDLRAEVKNSYGKGGIVKEDTGYVLEVITKERDCAKFTKWQQGFTPKEHRDMLDRQYLMEREDRRDRAARRMRIAEFIVALIAVGIIVLAAFIERGGQPTINIITPNPSGVTVEQQSSNLSNPDDGGSQK